MTLKVKKMKTVAQLNGTGKIDAKIYYPCTNIGVRHTCNYHCKKCFFEIVYSHK